MKVLSILPRRLLAAATAALYMLGFSTAGADAPCPPDGDFGECKVLIEINASDGDIGFHFLMDGDNLMRAAIYDPGHRKIFYDAAKGPLRRQFLTETFAESAEPLCWPDPDADEDDLENIVTLEEFVDRWRTGTYHFIGISPGWELSYGRTDLSFALPAAPDDIEFDVSTGVLSWAAGDDLGNCAERVDEDADVPNLADVINLLDMDPADVPIAKFEAVFEPDVEDDDPRKGLKYTVRVPPTQTEVTIPADYIASLGDDTPVKVEVGAIGMDDNATFTEEDGICVNENLGCE
ncbi:MAG: hypothetical protein OEO82_07205 [Gammaproteobacteria bacterium]|nr:hypothetical protein [Gammaproteobacteria bacterium]